MSNAIIADIFQQIADLLELQDGDHFRIISYQRATQTIRTYGQELTAIYQTDPKGLLTIPGIGKSLAEKIGEIITTGTCSYYQELLAKTEPGLLEIMHLRGIGPKRTKLFHQKLGIKNVAELQAAARAGRIRDLPGMGEKSEQQILLAISDRSAFKERALLDEALVTAENIVDYLKQSSACGEATYAGSLRRRKETIGDIDILATSKTKASEVELAKHFLAYSAIERVLVQGNTKISVLLTSGRQADLRIVKNSSFGAALHYFTGSKEHNIRVRDMARKKGLKVNEYGVFKGTKRVGGKTEAEIFSKVGLPYIEPELREDQGEIEAALKHQLPKLIELEDLKGDLQLHSNYTDGTASIADMAKAAQEFGLEYMALTDHTVSLRVAGGLKESDFKKQYTEIDRLNKQLAPFRILKSAEVDIKRDGSLDLNDAFLKQLDLVLISLHSNFKMDKEQQTKRLIKALEHPATNILGHPTGRILNRRHPAEFDFERVVKAAVANNVALEINAQPERLDLNDHQIRLAKDLGAKFVISSDSHSPQSFSYLMFGVAMARRGWLEEEDILDTLTAEKLLKHFKKTLS